VSNEKINLEKEYLNKAKPYIGDLIKVRDGWTFPVIINPFDEDPEEVYVPPTTYRKAKREQAKLKVYTAFQLMQKFSDDQIADALKEENISHCGDCRQILYAAAKMLKVQ